MGLLNLVRVVTPTPGTGAVQLGTNVQGFLTMAQAGAVNGNTYSYAIEADFVEVADDLGNTGLVATSREDGVGVWNSGTGFFTRNVQNSTNSNALLFLHGDAQFFITPNAADFAAAGAIGLRVSKTVDYAVTTADTGIEFDTQGAGGSVTLTLPPLWPGLSLGFGFCCAVAQPLIILASGGAKIALGTTNSVANGNITSSSPFSYVFLMGITSGSQWAVRSVTGNWALT